MITKFITTLTLVSSVFWLAAQDVNSLENRKSSLSWNFAYSAKDELLPEGYKYNPLSLLTDYHFVHLGSFSFYAEAQFSRASGLHNEGSNYGFGLNLGLRHHLSIAPFLELVSSIGSGPYYITVETRRQAKGFIFSDNFETGFRVFKPASSTAFQIRARYRHISNAGLKDPNGGIDNLFLIFGLTHKF